MNRPRLSRDLRIAISAVFGVMSTVLLLVLVRSYFEVVAFTFGAAVLGVKDGLVMLVNWQPAGHPLSTRMWIFVLITVGLSAAPWIPWRFSLLTLLITMTIVAALLGLAVWLTR
jgi:hypothetical protein